VGIGAGAVLIDAELLKNKSLLVLFFRKELLSFLTAGRISIRVLWRRRERGG
jgi:hypothetical protein